MCHFETELFLMRQQSNKENSTFYPFSYFFPREKIYLQELTYNDQPLVKLELRREFPQRKFH